MASSRNSGFGRDWEEAGGEFYQEGFKNNSLSSAEDIASQNQWATMLPSKQYNVVDAKTWGRTTGKTYRRGQTTKSRNYQSSSGDIELAETLPDLADGLADEEETWNQLQEIRSLPVSMATKRELKAKLLHAPTFRVHGMAALKLRRRQVWRHFRRNAGEFFSNFAPWQSSLRYIEANFGTGTASYFLLNRWLFLLNLCSSVLVASFVILPWELGRHSCGALNSTESYPGLEGCEGDYGHNRNDTDLHWLNYTEQVSSIVSKHSDDPLQILQDTIQGTGWLEFTLAFYGYYQPAVIPLHGDDSYDIGLCYILTVLGVFLFSLVCMARSAASGFRKNLSLGKAWVHRYSELLFASWDFCIDSTSVALLKKKAILQGLKAALADERFAEEKASRTTRTRVRLYLLRLLMNVVVLAVLTLCGYIIYWVTVKFPEKYASSPDDFARLFYDFLPSIVITALNFVVPIFFQFLVRRERYSATFEIKVSLLRTVLLRLSSLLVLIITLYIDVGNGLQTFRSKTGSWDPSNPSRTLCWETHVGQQLYRLCLFDIGVTVVKSLLIEFPMSLVFRRITSGNAVKYVQCLARPEFNIAGNTLDVIYSQSLCWLGLFYCPVLPIATAIKQFIVYYVKYFGLNYYTLPPSRVFGASRSMYLFVNVLLFSFVVCAVPVGYAILNLKPSQGCGPYRGFDIAWQVVSDKSATFTPVFSSIFKLIGSAAFFVPAIVVLLVAVYYFHAQAAAQRDLVNALKQQLVLEGQDKQFLLSRLLSPQNKQHKDQDRE